MNSPIVPAIIPQSYEDLVSAVAVFSSLPEIHVDVVDGVFVDSLSWPYNNDAIPAQALHLLERFSLEVDLMVEDQLGAAAAWLGAGADQLVFHIEVLSLPAFLQFVTTHAVTVGVSAGNDTPLPTLYPYLKEADYVQLMGIANIGSQGQSFDTRVLERITQIRTDFPNLPISIDGSVNAETINILAPLKLHRLIVGSAIIGSKEPLASYHALNELLRSQQG